MHMHANSLQVGLEMHILLALWQACTRLGQHGSCPRAGFIALNAAGVSWHAQEGFVENVGDVVAVGQEVRPRIISVDPGTSKIQLTLKSAEVAQRDAERAERKRSYQVWHGLSPTFVVRGGDSLWYWLPLC